MLGVTFSSKLDWCTYIIFTAKTASTKIGALVHSMNFLFPEVALYLFLLIVIHSMKAKQPLQGMESQEKEAQQD